MPPDDDFESFRSSTARLDAAGERRIRARFEELRDGAGPADADAPITLAPAIDRETIARRSRNRRILAGIAAAAALVALVVGVRLTGEDGAQVTAGFDELTLDDLATRASARADDELPADAVLYMQLHRGQRVPASGDLAPSVGVEAVERWAYRDGSGVERTEVTYTAEGPGEVPQAPDGVQETRVTEARPLFEVLPYDELRSLPATPEGLLDAARRVIPSEVPADTADWLSRVLSLSVTPPDVRAAAFEALAMIGGVAMGPVADQYGVSGIAFGDNGAEPSWMVVIDPTSTSVQAFAREVGPEEAPITGATRWVVYGAQDTEPSLPA